MLALQYSEAAGPASVYYYALGAGPISGIEWQVPEGSTASEQAVLAATQIAADAARLGLSVQVGAPEDYPPTPPEPEPDEVLQLYLDRAGPHAGPAQRVIARWAAYNHVQLESEREGWTQEAIATLLATPRTQAIVSALTTYGWGIAATLLAAATTDDHPLATPDVIQAYLDAMGAEGVLP